MKLKTINTKYIEEKLEKFLKERKEKFLNLTKIQKENWIKEIELFIKTQLNDNDIFYDNMPDDVLEVWKFKKTKNKNK